MLKKTLSILLSLCILFGILTVLPLSASAEISGDYQYEVLNDGTASITGYSGSSRNISIPSSIDGYTVTSISDSAFFGCSGLSEVIIPDSITTIGGGAFNGCSGITELTIPKSVISIGVRALDCCAGKPYSNIRSHLKSITVDNNNPAYCSIDGNLYDKSAATLIQYANGKTAETFTVPDSVMTIGESAFYNCRENLTSVIIPNSVTNIEKSAFTYCFKLTSIDIPSTVSTINDEVFSGCASLTSMTIPDSVTSIGIGAFSDCRSLISVTIPKSVTNIGEWAFYDCLSLQNIYGFIGTAAETYAIDNGIRFIPLLQITDPPTSVMVSVPKDITLIVEQLTGQEIDTLPDGSTVAAVYNITLTKNGETVQPDTPIQVKIPCGDPNAKVYRQETDGTYTDMNAVYKDGYLVFTSDHFSLYVLALIKSDASIILGDVDGDEEVTVLDATFIQRYEAGFNVPIAEEDILARGDVDGDEEVTVLDATYIQRYDAGFNTPYPIGEAV